MTDSAHDHNEPQPDEQTGSLRRLRALCGRVTGAITGTLLSQRAPRNASVDVSNTQVALHASPPPGGAHSIIKLLLSSLSFERWTESQEDDVGRILALHRVFSGMLSM